ncbi:NADH dehydrogenase 1, alpha/beta subcomplex subunit 1 NDUFAB1/ACP [Mucor lusitanicus]|uniref:Acyl carrier protein n=4 Tax=Mucor TaxID=4830 RepID=A0A162QTD4_MUCCL|nr:NADH dehydrogenase (ubiquinone) 1 alpha/beta subcomplex 1 [Mucor circinelloides 1006PhL]KAF1804542.1 NADH dehydrogenase 1, alpha/beta subcomplex subunit 1 NDUFAB1/ACP [Mucor lusitanicus]OAD05520.1 NADH dehydrogenase 1, alpha/beta subcomplex subunit 1 NDUFAB1/ACP [Mucor lusitanicus CBS 277.49]GAN07443.1 acyl carrier protein [Mucor ambiguus]
MFLRPNVILNAASRVATTQRTNMVRMATPSMLRMYATLPREDVQSRVLDVVKSFDKVDGSKVTAESNFVKDLGLDSLDTVEVVMAIEEEFSVEIPDKDADAIHSVQQAIDYIIKRDDAH